MKRKTVIGIMLLCIMLGITQILLDATNPTIAARRRKYSPIVIDGDEDFARKARKNGWPGSGTSIDPYIIEYYDLVIPYKKGKKSTIPSVAISISNTTVFFEIRYSTISNFNGEVDGILLWNVKHGKIYNNTIFNFVNSIFLVGSDYVNITNNNIQAYSESTATSPPSQNIRYKVNKIQAFISRGVFLDPSNHNIIVNNSISGFTGTGVELLDSTNNTIDGNEIDSSAGENGIFLAGSDYNNITNNEIYGYYDNSLQGSPVSQNIRYKVDGTQAFISRGVFLDPSNHNLIANNSISGFTGTGVELLDSANNTIDGNEIDSSVGENGVFLVGSDYNNITNNEIFGHDNDLPGSPVSQNIRYRVDKTQAFISRGVFLDPSNHNLIANNSISGFTGTGVELLDSANNTIDGNEINSSVGENGVFLAGSDYNNITNNEIFGHNNSLPRSPVSQNIRYRVDGTQAFISRGVFLDPSNHNLIANNSISGFTGTGVELLDSANNTIDGNEIDSSVGENGVFLAGSDYNNITNNEISGHNNDLLGSPVSQNIRYRVDGTQAFISRGVFLDPSNHNLIANNSISGFTGTGVELLDSANNTIDGNEIVNSFGENENGVFLVGSDYNNITNNEIYGYYDDSSPGSPISQNIRYRVDRTQAFISRGVFLDPSNHNLIANNTISNVTGTGVELLNSANNTLDGNEISNNAENGILLQGSSNTSVSHNVIYNDDIYGVTISSFSNNNIINWNDFIGNNIGGTSQINDDGSENQFTNNFLVDHDNTDSDNDSVSDNPYNIDGDASSIDYSPNSLPVQPLKDLDLALADLDADIDWESETLNLKNQGNWETVKISLPEGYSATNIDVSSIYTQVDGAGRLYANEEAQVQNPRTLIVKFDRPALVILLESALTTYPVDVNMNITGFLNGEFLMFYGLDMVKILNDVSESPVMIIDQDKETSDGDPTQIFIDQVIKPTVAIPAKILINQITSVSQMPFGLTIGILFAPMITTVVIRRFRTKK
ncbi:MAG: right-handed parallel beta-helix repeat-containing protein [Candidatus Heimdallarchaeota archaeon]|nr:MAG: right-handed parallel beta-helix repeat-containing protein [Candidatus Heimdallarchaeota archaeon]